MQFKLGFLFVQYVLTLNIELLVGTFMDRNVGRLWVGACNHMTLGDQITLLIRIFFFFWRAR